MLLCFNDAVPAVPRSDLENGITSYQYLDWAYLVWQMGRRSVVYAVSCAVDATIPQAADLKP